MMWATPCSLIKSPDGPLKTIKLLFGSISNRIAVDWRSVAAYIMMIAFIIGTSVGAAMVYPPAGWICFGVTSGLVGYILGAE